MIEVSYSRIFYSPDEDHHGAWVKRMVIQRLGHETTYGKWTWVRAETVPAGMIGTGDLRAI